MALPGVTTVIKDKFFTLSRTDVPLGARVVVIAPRNTADGTVDTTGIPAYDYDPYFATNEELVRDAYGNGSGAHRGYVEAVAGGAPQVFIVALPKNVTDANIQATGNVTITGDGTVHAHGAHNVLQAAFDAAETAAPDIIVAWGRGGHPLDWEDPATPSNDLPFYFYADNTTGVSTSLANRVATATMGITSRSNPCLTVMGIKPFVDAVSPIDPNGTMTAGQVASHVALPNLANHNDTSITTGMYVSIVGSELRPLGYDSTFGYSNGAALYAGQLTQTNAWNSTTGKLTFNVSKVRYNPTRTQLASMAAVGVVPVGLDFNRRPHWIDGVTWGATTSDYTRLSTLRIVFDAVQLVRNAALGFVGEGATLQNRNALDTAITASLRGMHQVGALLASDFVVSYHPELNEAIIDLVLTPAFELRNIEISVSVQFG